MSVEGTQDTACSLRSSGNSGTQTSGKRGHHMTKLEIIDEMPPAFLDVKNIMKKERSKRSMEERMAIKVSQFCGLCMYVPFYKVQALYGQECTNVSRVSKPRTSPG